MAPFGVVPEAGGNGSCDSLGLRIKSCVAGYQVLATTGDFWAQERGIGLSQVDSSSEVPRHKRSWDEGSWAWFTCRPASRTAS